MEPSVILAFFLLKNLSTGLFVLALPFSMNMGKACALTRLQLPHVYKVSREMEMTAKSPVGDNILLIWMCQIRIIEHDCCLSQDTWIWDWIISMAATFYCWLTTPTPFFHTHCYGWSPPSCIFWPFLKLNTRVCLLNLSPHALTTWNALSFLSLITRSSLSSSDITKSTDQ